MAFLEYSNQILGVIESKFGNINSFITGSEINVDDKTVDSFGAEWTKFKEFTKEEIDQVGITYFDIVSKEMLDKSSTIALDVGCGSGRWTKYLAPKVKFVECIDPSKAVLVAQQSLETLPNIRVSKAAVEDIPFPNESFDFVFSLGVLHHVPQTEEAIAKCVEKVKKGGYFLIYLYYNLDNRGTIFKLLLKVVTLIRKVISKLPEKLKFLSCDLIAVLGYLPFVLTSRFIKFILPNSKIYQKVPLSYYHDKSFNIIRNDSLDRFGTPLEQRFSKNEIEEMMKRSGLTEITFSPNEPYWHAVGKKA